MTDTCPKCPACGSENYTKSHLHRWTCGGCGRSGFEEGVAWLRAQADALADDLDHCVTACCGTSEKPCGNCQHGRDTLKAYRKGPQT